MTTGPRETPLARKLKARILSEGPIGVSEYMEACLQDPEHGYYRHRPAIGAGGDFVTAPEISQAFGELIGLWCAVVWQQMGSPSRLNLVELGPGRGTLMRDALRASVIVPDFRAALSVHLVESNATLRAVQKGTLAGCDVPVEHHDDAIRALVGRNRSIPDGAVIVIANEFFDAQPVVQIEFRDGVWHDRVVVVDEAGGLAFGVEQPGNWRCGQFVPASLTPKDGDIFEMSKYPAKIGTLLGGRQYDGPVAALVIDYGHAKSGFGDTLQGICEQRYVSPFHAPGESDLSVQVDFEKLASAAQAADLAVDGPVPQAGFLGQLGIVERASRLMSANPDKAGAIEAGVQRLLAPVGMGSRFLALGVRSPVLPTLPGFA